MKYYTYTQSEKYVHSSFSKISSLFHMFDDNIKYLFHFWDYLLENKILKIVGKCLKMQGYSMKTSCSKNICKIL